MCLSTGQFVRWRGLFEVRGLSVVPPRLKNMTGTFTIEQRRAAVAAATALLSGLGEVVVSVGNAELGPFFRQVDDLSRQVEAARVAILAEALGRGVVASSDSPSVTSWAIDWAPSYRAGGAAALVTVAHATQAVRNAGLAAAVLGARVGSVTLRRPWSRWTSYDPGCAMRPSRRSGPGSSRSPPTTARLRSGGSVTI